MLAEVPQHETPRLILLYWPPDTRALRDRIVARLVECGASIRAEDVLTIDAGGLASCGLDPEFEALRTAGGRILFADARPL